MSFLYFLLSFIHNAYVVYRMKLNRNYIPSFCFLPKMINILFEIAFSIELTITVIFWGIVYPNETDVSLGYILNTSNFHGGILITLWIENIFNAV